MNLPFLNRISFLEKVLFTRHLAIMLKAGIPITEAILVLKDLSKNAAFSKMIVKIASYIDNGATLAEALEHYKNVFGNLYINMIKVGEEGGTLEKSLIDLADHLEEEQDLNTQVRNAMLYPIIVLVLTFGIVSALSIFVLPQLINFFTRLNVELPLTTKVLLFCIKFSKSYGLIFFPSLAGLIILFFFLMNTPFFLPFWHRFLIRLPVIGHFIQDINLSYFCRNLGTMLKAGLPITESLLIAAESANNFSYKTLFLKAAVSINKGQTLESSFSSSPLIPTLVKKMVEVGEKTGNLEDNLLYLSSFYKRETDAMSKNLTTLLEPILLIFVGLIVGLIALSIISPIYQLIGSIRK